MVVLKIYFFKSTKIDRSQKRFLLIRNMAAVPRTINTNKNVFQRLANGKGFEYAIGQWNVFM